MNKDQIYKVTWRDHFHTDGWLEFNESDIIDSDVLIETVGFFMAEDKHYTHIAQSKAVEDETIMQVMSIMKKQITKVEELT